MDPAALADIDRLGDRLEDPVRLITDMGGIAGAVLFQHTA